MTAKILPQVTIEHITATVREVNGDYHMDQKQRPLRPVFCKYFYLQLWDMMLRGESVLGNSHSLVGESIYISPYRIP